jgi:hypothetical protein
VRFCSNFSRSSFRLCVKSIPSADSRSELCGTDTLRPRCVGCNRDFSLQFFKLNLRLPFTPPLVAYLVLHRVEWSFLRDMMRKLGSAEAWVNAVMNCVSLVSYRIKVNGMLTSSIIPERGLRQGDSLSPYLFRLCAEGFSALLTQAEAEGKRKVFGSAQVLPVCRICYLPMTL